MTFRANLKKVKINVDNYTDTQGVQHTKKISCKIRADGTPPTTFLLTSLDNKVLRGSDGVVLLPMKEATYGD